MPERLVSLGARGAGAWQVVRGVVCGRGGRGVCGWGGGGEWMRGGWREGGGEVWGGGGWGGGEGRGGRGEGGGKGDGL